VIGLNGLVGGSLDDEAVRETARIALDRFMSTRP